VLLILLVVLVLPRLQREIVGTPDTDMIFLSLSTNGNTVTRQMEEQTSIEDARILRKFGDSIAYTFAKIGDPNSAWIISRLKDKSKMNEVIKAFQGEFQNSPFMNYFVFPWNPSELPIPDPPHFKVSVLGGTARERLSLAKDISDAIQGKKIYSRVWQEPAYQNAQDIVIRPNLDQWAPIFASGSSILPGDLTDISRIGTQGRVTETWVIGKRSYNVVLYYPRKTISTLEDLAAFPIGIKNKIVPLKALAQINVQEGEPPRFRKNQQDVVEVYGKLDKGQEHKMDAALKEATAVVKDWKAHNPKKLANMSVEIEDAQFELSDALKQLALAVGLSILLIFVVMVIQLGDLVSSLLVLVSIPLGFVGVLLSLYIFKSTLSLNSVLGVILLNGIAVANSIILVDFFNKLLKSGKSIRDSALDAAHARLRPILMTSLTTTIGMMPIALGLGEGGRVLQPLGIAVSGGLWISMIFTLYLVPSLQVTYWNWRKHRMQTDLSAHGAMDEISEMSH
jgi:multidrug efflux pump subunit AcrB